MPSVVLPNLFENLPELTHLNIENLDEFKKDQFIAVHSSLLKYKGLRNLALEALPFDLTEVKQELLDIVRGHSASLTHIKLGRNLIPGNFLEEMFNALEGGLPSL